ncbi:hypothetical protein JCM15519_29160 [Fundidesulfovibrio butyratiphilus]
MPTKRIFAILMTFALFGVWALATAASQPTPAGKVTELTGQVEAKAEGQNARTLAKGADIFAKDIITTKTDKDKAKILFADDSVLDIGPSSAVAVADFVYDSADAAKSRQNLKLGKGVFRYVTGKVVAQNPDNLKMESPLSVIGIRGTTTDHWIKAVQKTKDGRTYNEVESELHALRATKTGSQVIVQTETERLVLAKPGDVAWVRPNLPGQVRPLTKEEMEEFSKAPFERDDFDPRPRRGLTGGGS